MAISKRTAGIVMIKVQTNSTVDSSKHWNASEYLYNSVHTCTGTIGYRFSTLRHSLYQFQCNQTSLSGHPFT